MTWNSKHLEWLVNTGKRLKTVDGKSIEIWEFRHQHDEAILSAWAKHFRNHYCLDCEIDDFRKGYKYTRAEYLNKIKFPDKSCAPGPSICSGDFGEILVADYLEFILDFWVPRTCYAGKDVRNESHKGCDIIGFKIFGTGDNPKDTLAIFEAKSQFSGTKPKPRLQDAVDDSAKDEIRKAESLNKIKQVLYYKGRRDEANRIDRFQNPEDKSYKEIFGAAALFSSNVFSKKSIKKTITQKHPRSKNLLLVVIHGDEMMKLVHELYRRAADEA